MKVVRDDRLSHVTFLDPTDEQVEEFRAILAAYVAGEGLGHPDGHGISERWAALDKPIGLYLQTSAELGQLWFLGHEVGHGFTSERFLRIPTMSATCYDLMSATCYDLKPDGVPI
jgi:hypothetical protein